MKICRIGTAPHVERWSERALPETTLWFWNTEIGWATAHPLLAEYGWEYRSCHVWDKGPGHIAGNANSKTLRRFPVVTEVCVQYVRKVTLESDGVEMTLKRWVRREWERTGLPMYKANDACGVKNAATRKYLTKCHLWYFPPPEAFERMARYANARGRPEGRPYFSLDGERPATASEWSAMRAKFHCDVGITNVWREPAVRGAERVKNGSKSVHMNQKPLRLLEQAIRASSDPGDVIWEPFGGLCSVAIASLNTGRQCHSAEILPEYFKIATKRLANHATSRSSCPPSTPPSIGTTGGPRCVGRGATRPSPYQAMSLPIRPRATAYRTDRQATAAATSAGLREPA